MFRSEAQRPVQMATNSQSPFGIIEIVAVAILILGTLWLASHIGMSLFCTLHGLPAEGLPQQIMNLFIFAVIECFALVLLQARGRLPYLDTGLLRCLVDYTFGNIPKLLILIIEQLCKRSNNRPNAN
jgi:hypothetical protein